jgi:hypothetical protein
MNQAGFEKLPESDSELEKTLDPEVYGLCVPLFKFGLERISPLLLADILIFDTYVALSEDAGNFVPWSIRLIKEKFEELSEESQLNMICGLVPFNLADFRLFLNDRWTKWRS